MKIVADTNVFLAVALDEPERAAIIEATADCDLAAPDVLPFEVGNALTAMMKKGSLRPKEVVSVWELVQRIPVELRRVDMRSALSIAVERSLYAYDACFLQCAVALRAPPTDAGQATPGRRAREGHPPFGGERAMKIYTYSEARRRLAQLLDRARKEEVVIERKDGGTFCVIPRRPTKSPFDVPPIRTNATTRDILEAVKTSRQRGAKVPDRPRLR
jgi:prevent-host-death family protein